MREKDLEKTLPSRDTCDFTAEAPYLGWTILWHSDHERVGEWAAWPEKMRKNFKLSRNTPEFSHPGTDLKRPLASLRLSRTPIAFSSSDLEVHMSRPDSLPSVVVEGKPVKGSRTFSRGDLEKGVILMLAHEVTLLLHLSKPKTQRPPLPEMIGQSAAMGTIYEQIESLREVDDHILIRGETGTGKELVARALTKCGKRNGGPSRTESLATVPPGLVAMTLFGSERGSFNGASKQKGLFRLANGGTLFLDEIGAAPLETQQALLRILEENTCSPVGHPDRRFHVDVRVLAATDRDLEEAEASGKFHGPLRQRFHGEILLPPLRKRREDIGRLFLHFLKQDLDELGKLSAAGNLEDTLGWPLPEIVAGLASYDWPGNVRELRNVVRRLVLAGPLVLREPQELHLWLGISKKQPPTCEPASHTERASERKRKVVEISAEELQDVIRTEQGNIAAVARRLNVNRASLHQAGLIRRAQDIDREELKQCLKCCGNDLVEVCAQLFLSMRTLVKLIKDISS